MSPNTLALLLKVRRSGHRPASNGVVIEFDNDPFHSRQRHSWVEQQESFARVHLPLDTRVDLIDLRCVVGLYVMLETPTWTDAAGRLVERIRQAAPRSLLVCITDAMLAASNDSFGGFAWLPKVGDLTFNEWCDQGCGRRAHG
jgi:hypothetical protein